MHVSRGDTGSEGLHRASTVVVCADRRWSRVALPLLAGAVLAVDVIESLVDPEIDPSWPTAFVLCAALAAQGWVQVPATVVAVLVQTASPFWGVDTPGMSVVVPLVCLFELISTGRVRAGLVCAALFLGSLLLPRDIDLDTWLEWAMLTVIVTVFGISWWRGRLLQAAAVARARAAVEDAGAARAALGSARADLARDLHDLSAADLSRLIILAQSRAWSTPADRDHAEVVADEARCALMHMRMLMSTLDAPAGSGAGSVQDTLDSARTYLGSRGIDLVPTITGDAEGLPPAARILLRSVLVETTTNTFKHARDDSVMEIGIEVTDDDVALTALSETTRDAPAHDDAVLSGGTGLRRLVGRVEAAGGTVRVEEADGHWLVRTRFPLTPQA